MGALCRAVADTLDARYNPVTVEGEVSGFSRASSGHCYFSLKDNTGQIRCAMFRRAADLLDFSPRDGDRVELRGRITVYEARGDLQLVVESLKRAGQGNLFEAFLRLKTKLEAQGLFDTARKRELPAFPRAIGLVTSLGAAALHDVVSALQRRAPYVQVVLAPASVQGVQAPSSLVAALQDLYDAQATCQLDVILLVRGGGSIEDLWAFNDEALAHVIAQSPVPVVCGVGHETDFTIADFVSDVRAPTPTAAAELVAQPRAALLAEATHTESRLQRALFRQLDHYAQRTDRAAARLGRPSQRIMQSRGRLQVLAQGLAMASHRAQDQRKRRLLLLESRLSNCLANMLPRRNDRLEKLAVRLELLNPRHVLERGFVMLTNAQGEPVTSVDQTQSGQLLRAALADGEVDVTVV
ncbi:MAG: hypothetical protein RL459_564 [Pseudomonadota bacterium]